MKQAVILLAIFASLTECFVKEVDVDLDNDKEVTLECPVDNAQEDVFLLWYKKDKETGTAVELEETTELLTIKFPTEDKMGEYSCKDVLAENEHIQTFLLKGERKRKPVKPTPRPGVSKPVWRRLPNPRNRVNNLNSYRFICDAGGQGVTLKAHKLDSNGRIIHTYPFKGVALPRPRKQDSGKYRCVASNAGGTLTYDFDIVVTVNGGWSLWSAWSKCDRECGYGRKRKTRTCTKPAPTADGMKCAGKETVEARCRDNTCSKPRLTGFGYFLRDTYLELICSAKGIPTPKVQWRFEEDDLPKDYKVSEGVYRIPKAKARYGEYSCFIQSAGGYFTMYISIDN